MSVQVADDAEVVTVRRFEDASWLRTWLRRWLVVVAAAALATIGFLVAIDIALGQVDSSMTSARNQAFGVSRNTARLPFLLAQMTQHLEHIEGSLKTLPPREVAVAAHLSVVDSHLQENVKLNHEIHAHQSRTDAELARSRGELATTESQLATILRLNTDVRNVLADAQSSTSTGTRGLIAKTGLINAAQAAARRDSGNILQLITATNRHLYAICTAPQMEALGGAPPC